MTNQNAQPKMGKREQGVGAVMEMNETESTKKYGSGLWSWAERVGKRNWIIIGAVALVGVAIALNVALFSGSTQTGGYADYGSSSGMTDGSPSDQSGAANATKEYFATVAVNRQRARDESMEVLQQVLDSEDATETVKNEALSEMNAIALEIEKEANIEALLLSKGFEDCVAVMNGNSINVVVQSEGDLQVAQIAQINTVVYEQTGIEPLNVTIVHKN